MDCPEYHTLPLHKNYIQTCGTLVSGFESAGEEWMAALKQRSIACLSSLHLIIQTTHMIHLSIQNKLGLVPRGPLFTIKLTLL